MTEPGGGSDVAAIKTHAVKDGDDYMYVATMLLKHSMVLYRTFLDEKEICKMLDHVGKTITKEAHSIENYIDTDNTGNPPTVH